MNYCDNGNLNESFNSGQAMGYMSHTLSANQSQDDDNSENDFRDNCNAYATLPSNLAHSLANQSQANQANLFQYENYIPKKQIAFFNRINSNNPQRKVFPKEQKSTAQPLSSINVPKVDTKPPLLSSLMTDKEDFKAKSYQQTNQGQGKNNPNTPISTLFAMNNDTPPLEHSTPISQTNNLINTNLNANYSHHTHNHFHHNQTNSHKPSNTISPNENSTFSNYFNNCITHPYFNSYFHYKLFDSNGEEISKLIYKNSDKVTLFVDDKRRLQERLIPIEQAGTAKTELELLFQEEHSHRWETTLENETKGLEGTNITEVIQLEAERHSNGENRQEAGFFPTDKDKSADSPSYKPY